MAALVAAWLTYRYLRRAGGSRSSRFNTLWAKERVQNLRTRLKEVATSAILDAAEEVFADEGLDARMETIAARAGVSVGTLYNHFADRVSLVASLTDTRRAKFHELLKNAIEASSELPLREHLVHVILSVCDVSGTQARFRRRLIEAHALGMSTAALPSNFVLAKPR